MKKNKKCGTSHRKGGNEFAERTRKKNLEGIRERWNPQ